MTESKLDNTVLVSEVNLAEYDILWCDRNRNGGGVACYIRKDLCFNTRTLHCKEIENLLSHDLLPKLKPKTIGVFYGPPYQANFMDLMVEKFPNLNLKYNEVYLFDDFNINHFQNSNYVLNGKRSITCQRWVHILINRYKEFCQIYSLEQLITCPARVTCNKSSFIDHILTNSHCVKSVQIRSFLWSVFSCVRTEYGDLLETQVNKYQKKTPYLDTFHVVSTEKIFQSSIIDTGISDHQLTFCTGETS